MKFFVLFCFFRGHDFFQVTLESWRAGWLSDKHLAKPTLVWTVRPKNKSYIRQEEGGCDPVFPSSRPYAGPSGRQCAKTVPLALSKICRFFFPGCKIQSSWCAQRAVANAPRGLVQNVSVLLICLCLIAGSYAALWILGDPLQWSELTLLCSDKWNITS